MYVPNSFFFGRAEATPSDGREHSSVEVGGVVNRALEVMEFERGDEGARASSGVLIPCQTNTQHLVGSRHHHLVER